MAHTTNEAAERPYVKSAVVSVGQLVKNIKTDGTEVANGLVTLGKAEVQPMVKHAGIGGGMFGAAGYLALNALSLLFMAGGFAFSMIFNKAGHMRIISSLALGYVCMAVLLLLVTGILALLGKGQISKVGAPKQTIAEAKASIDTLKQSVQRGKDTVTADELERTRVAEAKKQAKQQEKDAKKQAKDLEKASHDLDKAQENLASADANLAKAEADAPVTTTPARAAGVPTTGTTTTTTGTTGTAL